MTTSSQVCFKVRRDFSLSHCGVDVMFSSSLGLCYFLKICYLFTFYC